MLKLEYLDLQPVFSANRFMPDPRTAHSHQTPTNFSRFETKGARLLKLLEQHFPVAIDLHPDQLADNLDEAPRDEPFRVTDLVWDMLERAPSAQASFIAISEVIEKSGEPSEPDGAEICAALQPVIARFRDGRTETDVFAAELAQAGAGIARFSPFRCRTPEQATRRVKDWLYCPFVTNGTLDAAGYALYLDALRQVWRPDESHAAERLREADAARADYEATQRQFRELDRAISTGVMRYFVQGRLMSSDGPGDDDGVWRTCVLTPMAVMTSFKQVPPHLLPRELMPADGGDSSPPTEARSIAQMLAADIPTGVAKGFGESAAEGLGGALANSCGALAVTAFRALCALVA